MDKPPEKKDSSHVVRQRALLQRLFGDEWERAAERLRYLEARRQGGSAKR